MALPAGLGYGMAAGGFGMNALGIGGNDPYAGVNSELGGIQKGISGGWGYQPGYSPMFDILRGRTPQQKQFTPGRTAPQAGAAALAQTSGFRANQQELVSRLEALSKGQGPSLAAEQLRQATDRNMSQQASIAQTGRGNAALAGIQASNMSGALGAQAASDSAAARIQEQQMAFQLLGGAIGQGRGQDQEHNQFNALQTNFRDQFNTSAQLQARGQDDDAFLRLMQIRAGLAQQKANQGLGNQLMAGGAGLLAMQGSSGKKA
jgi:hypothetical protein